MFNSRIYKIYMCNDFQTKFRYLYGSAMSKPFGMLSSKTAKRNTMSELVKQFIMIDILLTMAMMHFCLTRYIEDYRNVFSKKRYLLHRETNCWTVIFSEIMSLLWILHIYQTDIIEYFILWKYIHLRRYRLTGIIYNIYVFINMYT